jgi:uracil-DNA glycosylase family 4
MNLENILKTFEDEEKREVFRDCEFHGEEKIVFLHDCLHRKQGKTYQFPDKQFGILSQLLEKSDLPSDSYQFVAAIKCANLTEDDVTTKMFHEHREYLEEDIKSLNPDLIIPLGNLALKTLTKKSGITMKRGKEFWINVDDVEIPVVPTLHPFSLYAEPKVRKLFLQDVNNAYAKFILKTNKFDDSPYELINGDLDRFNEVMDIVEVQDAVAFDLETEGLDFKKHKIQTIGFSYAEKQAFVLPINHKEGEFSPTDLKHIKSRIDKLMCNKNIVKVAHNASFDLKFLMNWGITKFEAVEDTRVIHALVDENKPHSLMDLVKEYFPQELEAF